MKSTNGNLQWRIHGVALYPMFPHRIGIRNAGFCGWRKPREPGEKPSVQGRERTTKSTHKRRELLDLTTDHAQWWKASALTTTPYPCSLALITIDFCQVSPLSHK